MEIFINNAKVDVDPETEKYIRELEAANDDLYSENERLQEELEEATKFKVEDSIVELKRMLIEELESIPAQEMKDFLVRTVFEALTGSKYAPMEKAPEIRSDHRLNYIYKFCVINFPNPKMAEDFYYYVKSLLRNSNDSFSIMDMNDLLADKYPEARYGDKSKPDKRSLDYGWCMYGWTGDNIHDNKITYRSGSNVVFFDTFEDIETRERV